MFIDWFSRTWKISCFLSAQFLAFILILTWFPVLNNSRIFMTAAFDNIPKHWRSEAAIISMFTSILRWFPPRIVYVDQIIALNEQCNVAGAIESYNLLVQVIKLRWSSARCVMIVLFSYYKSQMYLFSLHNLATKMYPPGKAYVSKRFMAFNIVQPTSFWWRIGSTIRSRRSQRKVLN